MFTANGRELLRGRLLDRAAADLEPATLRAALTAGTTALLLELRYLDTGLADRLAPVLEAAAGR